MKSKLVLSLLFSSMVSTTMASCWYLDGDVGNVTINQNRPISSTGRQFSQYNRFEHTDSNGNVTHTTTNNFVILRDARTGLVNLGGWDIGLAGNCNIGGNLDCNNVMLGIQGRLVN